MKRDLFKDSDGDDVNTKFIFHNHISGFNFCVGFHVVRFVGLRSSTKIVSPSVEYME